MNMHGLGNTRSAHRSDHLLHTPDTFVRAPLPGMRNATAIVHVGPAAGAGFTQYTVEFEPGGILEPTAAQRFVHVLEGALGDLRAGGYAYVPAGADAALSAAGRTVATVIEKPYRALAGAPTPFQFTGHESDAPAQPLMGDDSIEVRTLVPPGPAYDFAVNLMTFQPGAALPMVEIHVMEHGLLMLAGGGIYRLGDHWYPVAAGDFIWMAPYCPQWFGAIGKIPARYLIYKDWNRHPL